MDVHYSSGVINKAFYVLCTEYGWSVKDAFAIFVVANRMYWSYDTSWFPAVCGLESAVDDLW